MNRTRKLSAIMFTDIEGYTALMQKNEEEAVLYRDTHRKIFNTNTEKFNGRIINYYGDGTLSIFDSALDAVNCAISMQRAFRNEPTIPVRIGIHSGDVIFSEEEGDIIGDSVNVASRIESLAVPGSVFISDKVFDEIKNKGSIETTFLDNFHLKNVSRPTGVYAISNEGLTVPLRKAISGKIERGGRNNLGRWIFLAFFIGLLVITATWAYLKLAPGKPESNINRSVAVLPFHNLSKDPEQEYFVAGMQDALIGRLAQLGALTVKSRTSTLKFINTEMSIPEIARELDVDVLIEGSVLHSGDSVRIQVQLIDALPVEKHLWENTYDRKLINILSLHNEIVRDVVSGVQLALTPSEEILFERSEEVNKKAYELYLRGKFHISKFTRQDLQLGLEYFQKAIEEDPAFALAYVGISSTWANLLVVGADPPDYIGKIMHENVDKALELDSTLADAQYADAIVTWAYDWNWKRAEQKFQRALELNPNHAEVHIFYSHYLAAQSRPEEAILHANRALELDPLNPFLYGLNAAQLMFSKKFDLAEEAANKALEMDPNNPFAHAPLSGSYSALGDFEKAFEEIKMLYSAIGDREIVESFNTGFSRGGYKTALISGAQTLEKRAEHTYVKPHLIAVLYNLAEEKEKVLYWLEKCYEVRDHDMIYLNVTPYRDEVREDLRFKALLQKLNF